jgi:arabinose-5-phosphate isomerase
VKRKSNGRSDGSGRIDLTYARRVVAVEAHAVADLRHAIDAAFVKAAELIFERGRQGVGRLVTTGVGKAGLIAQKISATFASTGTPALFMHPTEARHGDLGMLTPRDVVLGLSNSGESDELTQILPAIRKMRVPLIAMTGRPNSTLGHAADCILNIGRIEEPCPLRMAPSASTTAMLALGDALALCVLKARNFTAQDYARLHPGGALGRKLMKASDLMRTGERLALARPEQSVGEALERMSVARGGAVVIVDAREKLLGVFTDGDFRRLMVRDPGRFHAPVGEYMTSPCKFIRDETLVAEAQALMAEKHINALPVVGSRGRVVGLMDIQDLVGFPVL